MIDMHMHTTYSDGSKTLAEILKMCEEKHLDIISITDHDNVRQYEDDALKNPNLFHGRIIKGTELHAVFNNRSFEVLAYNIEPRIINEWLKKYYSEDELRKQQKIFKERLFKVCDTHGLKYNPDNIPIPPEANKYIEPYLYSELIKHKKNIEIMGELATSLNIFYRKGLTDPESSYFVNFAEFKPQYKEVIEIIHKAGGKAFLAHPFEYQMKDTFGFIKALRVEKELDGIECYHPSAAACKKIDALLEYAKDNNLFISGGSDYHGKPKPTIEIGVGEGDLRIPTTAVEPWINL